MNLWAISTYVSDSAIHGKGRFTEHDIKSGSVVLQIDGNIYKNENQSYVNHSLNNNLDYIGDNTWVAKNDICAGEELTMNYLQWIKSVPF